MRTKNPIKGLLIFTFFSVSKSLSTNLVICLLLAGGFLISGQVALYGMFTFIATLGICMSVIMGLASKEGKWERFQLTMPVSRSGLLLMQYMSVLLVAILGAFMLAIVIAIGTFMLTHDVMFNDGLVRALMDASYLPGMPLLMTGVCFPLASTKFGKDRGGSILTISMLVSAGIMVLVPQAGYRLGLPIDIISALVLAVSVAVFVVSYFITKAMYAKSDF